MLACVNIATSRKGRVFLPTAMLQKTNIKDMEAELERIFFEDDDAPRFRLLWRCVLQSDLKVFVHPSYDDYENKVDNVLHVYFSVSYISEYPIFACLLAPMSALPYLIEPSGMLYETATFQAIDDLSRDAVEHGVHAWISRLWPEEPHPILNLDYDPEEIAEWRASCDEDE